MSTVRPFTTSTSAKKHGPHRWKRKTAESQYKNNLYVAAQDITNMANAVRSVGNDGKNRETRSSPDKTTCCAKHDDKDSITDRLGRPV